MNFTLTKPFIPLNALLKTMGISDSGGQANHLIVSGLIKVNGELQLQKRYKVKSGDVITYDTIEIQVS